MRTWPDRNGSAIGRFVQLRRLYHPSTPTTYRSVLRGFQDAAERHERLPSRVSRRTLETWLRECSVGWAPSTVFHNARIVGQFLDFLVREKLIASNPIKDLQAKYNLRGTHTVWQALLAPKPDQQLEALRQLPQFGSVLGGLMRNHVAMMRARGYRYDTQESTLLRFDRFLQRHPELAKEPLQVKLQRWAAVRSTVFHATDCERLGRYLAKGKHHLDPSVPIPKPGRRPGQQVARQWRRPYIYSSEEVRRLLDIARAYPSPRGPLRPLALYTMLAVGYCAGLRVGEIARLNLGEVDLQAGTITIRKTKFFKSRILPLASTVIAALREYVDERRRAGGSEDPESALFWQRQGRQRYGIKTIDRLFADILRQAGLKPLPGRRGPRFHDLRHSMVVRRILMWYRAGINPQDRLPFLATYLGHRDIYSTPSPRIFFRKPVSASVPWGRAAYRPRRGTAMKKVDPFPALLRAFFYEWMVEQRNASSHTIRSYRDTWRLFLRFVSQRHHRTVAQLRLTDLTGAEVRAFLQYGERERGGSIGTRNCRLAALRSFFGFVAGREPAAAEQCAEILRIPTKRAPLRAPSYLEPAEVEAILAQPDRSTIEGQRDHALLSFLYNTGARIQEALDLCPKAVRLEPPACVRLYGKGQKERLCPLWPETVSLLKVLLRHQPRSEDERLFVNRYGEPLGPSGVRFKLAEYVTAAATQMPSIASKHVTPHSFRHATAVHLVAAGVDITVIRSWLGHVSLDTTNHYAQANLETKRKALERVGVQFKPDRPPRWKRDRTVLEWLDSL